MLVSSRMIDLEPRVTLRHSVWIPINNMHHSDKQYIYMHQIGFALVSSDNPDRNDDHVCMYVFMYVCMYVRMYVFMYVCMYCLLE